MKKHILFLFAIFIIQFLHSQTTFEKTFGSMDDDEGFSVDICEDGSYLVCGYTTEFFYGYEDMYILKISSNGDTLWTKIIGSADEFEWAYSIKSTNDGGFVVSGFMSEGDRIPCILKFDVDGEQEWIQTYSDIIPDGSAIDIIQTSDTGYAVCGRYTYTDSGSDLWGSKIFLLKTDSQGEVEWTELYGGPGGHYPGCLLQKEDGGFAICGQYDTPGEYDAAWLFITSANGSMLSQYTSGGNQTTESASDMKRTSDGGYILCGTKFNGFIIMGGEIQLQKISPNLNEEWTKNFSSGEDDRGSSVDITNNGDYILCGSTKGTASGYNDVWLILTDQNGDTIWTKTYGGYYGERAYSVKSAPDGGFIICGMTWSMGNGMSDVYLIKTNFQGTLVWSKEYSVPGYQTKVFPNPGSGIYNIHSSNSLDRVEVLNINGQLMKQINQSNPEVNTMEFNIEHFRPGAYFVRLYSGQKSRIHKIIKH